MFLARVIGKVISTQKCEKLVGGKLLVIKSLDENKNIIENSALVALDSVGAGIGDIVLVDWGSTIYEDKKIAADMAIVGIVDDIQLSDN
ncbi:ethanolamine utilization protein EutN [Desulforamulus putei DSM 12395]|uniref:Ethanolamine utilization protein EutN n=1 Tax=Desulforamulus putei DSM 12395 TaxID=1121429 RepID=A0A1M5CBM6_9FIRM|nr:EutN/CcmL family microcompartment protein [Desulforamulus putei]SHF52111.1 ethanolamine utilization protein EutN [Desulforamulus putei DSM 12395]